jgi:serine/threonine-protein kinase
VAELLEALRRAALGARSEAGVASALGVGIYLEIRLRGEIDEIDDALGTDIGFILDLAEEELHRERFALAALTGSSVLGVRPLPEGTAARLSARASAVEVAALLHERVSARPDADPRVHANLCVHVDDLTWRAGAAPEVAGGALVRAEAWAPRSDVLPLCATAPAIEGLTAFDSAPLPDGAPGPLFILSRRARP